MKSTAARRPLSSKSNTSCPLPLKDIFSSLRSVIICWLDMYPEDFYDPQNEFAMTTNLLEFGHRHSLSDLRAKTRKCREHFKRIQADGGLVGMFDRESE